MILRRIYHEQLAQASYLVGCAATGEALVVDPNRDLEQYTALAQHEGLRVTAVAETHIHADFVSGARELARRAGARLYLSDAGPSEWKYAYTAEAGATLLSDGDTFKVGNILIEARHTPGHTPEHLSFLVTDTAGANEPMGVFTGDFVFVGDVGRPDLLEKAAGIAGSTEQAGRDLFRSLQRFKQLPDFVQIWPGHGAGSACGRALGAVPQSTAGYEKRFNWAFGIEDEARFMAAIVEGQPAAPVYFAQMKRVNKEGPRLTGELPVVAELPLDRLAQDLESGLLVVDLRPPEAYAAGHIPGTLNLPFNNAFLNWAGWLLPYDRPFALLGDAAEASAAVDALRLIGLDAPHGFWTIAAIDRWKADGRALGTVERGASGAARALIERDEVVVLDVRNPSEYAAGHIAGSRNIPLAELGRRMDELPADRPVLVHCQGGARSAIAAGLLAARWRNRVIDLQGGFGQWQAAGNPVERGEPAAIEPGAPEQMEDAVAHV